MSFSHGILAAKGIDVWIFDLKHFQPSISRICFRGCKLPVSGCPFVLAIS
ncbi:hypothetical protein BN135_3796 [Cronobacter muytjensii 530]